MLVRIDILDQILKGIQKILYVSGGLFQVGFNQLSGLPGYGSCALFVRDQQDKYDRDQGNT